MFAVAVLIATTPVVDVDTYKLPPMYALPPNPKPPLVTTIAPVVVLTDCVALMCVATPLKFVAPARVVVPPTYS